ncbi:CpsD/CapB family tyrosine-protein kinase [Motilibacter deserti]|uniref:CpsD/CapB family tyrosine-protein kinase n=1 Tax=Motilibacter deserti TaxID=2714956 RepID=A0ABX0GSD5_9ACTN|nr:CpsD/CapB family tyrosine-protein kinase [Motilibacter deserti]NHC13418.1 CpsD/CapB family tyrosine-protein kinase [Motilibacter deserti]
MTTTTAGAAPPSRPLLDRRALRQWPVVLGAAVLGAVAGVLLQLAQADTWTASTRIDMAPAQSLSSPDQTDRLIQAELLYLTGPAGAQALAAAVPDAADVALSARQVGLTDLLEVQATAPSRDAAEGAATAGARAVEEHVRQGVQERLTSLQQEFSDVSGRLAALPASGGSDDVRLERASLQAQYDALLASLAQARVAASSPQTQLVDGAAALVAQDSASPARGAALGGLLGAVVGLALVLVRRRVWRVDDAEDLEALNVRALGALPTSGSEAVDLAALRDRPAGDPVESAARQVAGRLLPVRGRVAPVAVVQALEAGASAAASSAALDIAVALARQGPTVLVCAADVYERRIGRWFNLTDDAYGLADLKLGQGALPPAAEILQPTGVSGLFLLPAGKPGPRAVDLAEDNVAGPLLQTLRDADLSVVVDAPSADRSVLVHRLAALAPAVALVALAGRTRVDVLERGIEDLTASGVDPAGVVVVGSAGARRIALGKHR